MSEVRMAAGVPICAANMRSASNVRNADVSTHDKSPLQLLTAVATSLLPLQLPIEVSIITSLIYIVNAIIVTAGITHCITYISVAYPDIFSTATV